MALESWNSVIPGLQNSKLVEFLMGTSWECEETERKCPTKPGLNLLAGMQALLGSELLSSQLSPSGCLLPEMPPTLGFSMVSTDTLKHQATLQHGEGSSPLLLQPE